jgi:hypothetical protein
MDPAHHLKDSVRPGEDRKYGLTGRGKVPIWRLIAALHSMGCGRILLSEKRWHPDLKAPEVAIADCAQTMSGYLGEGVGRSVAGQR